MGTVVRLDDEWASHFHQRQNQDTDISKSLYETEDDLLFQDDPESKEDGEGERKRESESARQKGRKVGKKAEQKNAGR